MGDLFWSDPEDYSPGVFDGDGVPRRLLCYYVLGSTLPHNGAKALNRLFHRLSFSADHRLICWLSRRRLARRSDRTTKSFFNIFAWRNRYCAGLYSTDLTQRSSLGARL